MSGYERLCAEINLDALRHNIKEIRKNLNENTKLVAVVKADACTHGSVQIAKAALLSGADMLSVAIAREALTLREAGITAPVMIMGAIFKDEIKEVLENDINPTVISLEAAKEINEIAGSSKKARVHIKLDTGMGRIGFLPGEKSAEEIAEIFAMKNIEVLSLFSHFSSADSKDKTYAKMQASRFNDMLELLKKRGLTLPATHISNSAAIIDHREYNYDIVRPGIILYGIYPSHEVDRSVINLQPVMTLRGHLTNVKTIAKGECVSYGQRFTAEKETVVATIPAGYADGYRRGLTNKGRVIIGGEYAPIIGTVCMDQCMADVTHIKGVKTGDEVILMGRQGDKEVTAEEIADLCDTIPYEIVCGISKRVPRVYIGE